MTSIASLLGVGLYNGFLKTVPLRKIFLVTTIFGTGLGMTQVGSRPLFTRKTLPSIICYTTNNSWDRSYVLQVILVSGFNRQLGISDEWFAIGDSLILTVLAQVYIFVSIEFFKGCIIGICDSIVNGALLEFVNIYALTA